MFEILKCLFLSHALLLTPEPITFHGSFIIREDVIAINDGAHVYIDVTSMINHKYHRQLRIRFSYFDDPKIVSHQFS